MAMKRFILSVCLMAFSVVPAAAADVRLDSYRNPKDETFRIFNKLYLDGVRGGLLSYSAWLKSRGGQAGFCIPENHAMTSEQAEEIMLKSADKRSAKGDMPVASLLFWGLQDTYPCPLPQR